MNRNSKGRLNIARRNAAKGEKSTSFDVPKLISGIGENATWGNYGTKTINFQICARLSKKPKVAAKGKRNASEIQADNERAELS